MDEGSVKNFIMQSLRSDRPGARRAGGSVAADPRRLAALFGAKTRCFLLLVLLAARPLVAGDFEFVVIGDTRPRFATDSFRIFEGLITRINELHPASVINLGDLIYGYGPPSKGRQWTKYKQVIQEIQVPYHQVPGNHDTHSKEARRLYTRQFGRGYGSFEHGGCHFVLLDNTEEGHWGYLGPTQLAWLQNDLRRAQPGSSFVFMHFPLWELDRIAPAYHAFWLERLHPLFKETRVRAVFAGHFHSYGPSRVFDGIQYFISGGGGAELRPDYRKSGGQYHFLRVTVAGDTFALRVVTPRGELSDAEADVMGGVLFADRHSSRIGLKPGTRDLRQGIICGITLSNPYPAALTGNAQWRLDASTFSVRPASFPIEIPPGGSREFPFILTTLKETAPLQALPSLEFNVVAEGRHHRFHREVVFLRELLTPYRRVPPTLDGRLEDWDGVPSVRLGDRPGNAAEVWSAHDQQALYLAVRLPAVTLSEADESAFPDAMQLGFPRRLSEYGFGGDLLRLGLDRGQARAEVKDRTPSRKEAGAAPAGVRCAARAQSQNITYELVVPLSLVKPWRDADARHLILNLAYPVAEGEAGESAAADPQPNSFGYQVRYGSDALVPVHFLELVLQPKP